jgi:hypothetical protein
MKRPIRAIAAVLFLGLPGIVQAQQTDLYFQLGAVWAAPLLHDDIAGEEITTQQSIAPFVRLGAGLPLATNIGVGLEATAAWGGYSADNGGPPTQATSHVEFLAKPHGRRPAARRAGIGMIRTVGEDKASSQAEEEVRSAPRLHPSRRSRRPVGARVDTHALANGNHHGDSAARGVPQVSRWACRSSGETVMMRRALHRPCSPWRPWAIPRPAPRRRVRVAFHRTGSGWRH